MTVSATALDIICDVLAYHILKSSQSVHIIMMSFANMLVSTCQQPQQNPKLPNHIRKIPYSFFESKINADVVTCFLPHYCQQSVGSVFQLRIGSCLRASIEVWMHAGVWTANGNRKSCSRRSIKQRQLLECSSNSQNETSLLRLLMLWGARKSTPIKELGSPLLPFSVIKLNREFRDKIITQR